LETDRLTMRKILPRDEEDMYEYAKDPETSRYLLWEPHRCREFTRSHIRYLQEQYRKAAFFDWALIDKKSGKMIGTCGFTEIYEREKRAEVGYVLSPAFHRQGLIPEALEKMMAYGFETLGLLRLEGRFMEDNEASKKVLLRAGFSDATTKNETIFKRGKKQRILTYALDVNTYRAEKKNR
jgi:ribosomal-protein-alanine N-acetyltransferase